MAVGVGWIARNAGRTTENDNANDGVLRQMEEILRRTVEILKWLGGVEAEGAVGEDKGKCSFAKPSEVHTTLIAAHVFNWHNPWEKTTFLTSKCEPTNQVSQLKIVFFNTF